MRVCVGECASLSSSVLVRSYPTMHQCRPPSEEVQVFVCSCMCVCVREREREERERESVCVCVRGRQSVHYLSPHFCCFHTRQCTNVVHLERVEVQVCGCVCMCVCARESEQERERESACVRVCERECALFSSSLLLCSYPTLHQCHSPRESGSASVCVHVNVCVCVYVCMCACSCVCV